MKWDTSSHERLMSNWTKATIADGGQGCKDYCDMSGEPLIEGLIVGSPSDKLSDSDMEQVRIRAHQTLSMALLIPSLKQLADVRVQDQKDYLQRWAEGDIDALITPVQTFTGFRPRTWVKSKQWVGYTAIWNWLGFASLAVPVTTITEENSTADEEWKSHVPRNDSDRFNWEICTYPLCASRSHNAMC
jgi:amidase